MQSISAATLVATEDGLRPISTIAVGDMVLAYNETTHTTGLFTVTDVLVNQDPVQIHLTIDDAHIETTPEHPFYTWERGWVNAGELRVGEHIHQANGGYGIVRAVVVETEPQVMYNLTVAEAHTFFVGEQRLLVHNDTCLQTGGHTLTSSSARALNKAHGLNLHPREWGRALEALKKDLHLPNNHHGKVMESGEYLDAETGESFGNLLWYLP